MRIGFSSIGDCRFQLVKLMHTFRGGSRINLRVLQNFTKKNDHRNDVICRKIIDSTRSKNAQLGVGVGVQI